MTATLAPMTIVQASPNSKVGFECFGANRDAFYYRGAEMILSGPYETGKTLALLQKYHMTLWKYAGARLLMVRDTYQSLIQSAVVTYEQKVLPYRPDDPKSRVKRIGGVHPEMYQYANGSLIGLGGMDNPGKFLSSEWDFIYINQAEELELEAYEALTGRVTGRAANAPYHQIGGDCNPSVPDHWILTRDSLKVFHSRHEDNPTLFNQTTGEITERGKATMETLDALTGIRYQRGRLGLWVAAEGLVFDNWSPAENITEAAEYDPSLPVQWWIDDGYARGQGRGSASYHPRVFLLAQQTSIGGVKVFAEYVATEELEEKSIEEVLKLPYRFPDVAYIDSSAVQLKARVQMRGIMCVPSTHPVTEGVRNVRRMIGDGRGMRLLHIHPRCKETAYEMLSLVYDEKMKAAGGEIKPVEFNNHCVSCIRYGTWHLRYGA